MTNGDRNVSLEEAALIADAEAQWLDALAASIRQQIAASSRRGLKGTLNEYLAGARAARRIAENIRKAKISEEER